MRIGILGTGVLGKTLGTKLAKLGHHVFMGSRAAGGTSAKA
jgi:predicted dinucleotide-binding enzyme